jgi:hypothetical protein
MRYLLFTLLFACSTPADDELCSLLCLQSGEGGCNDIRSDDEKEGCVSRCRAQITGDETCRAQQIEHAECVQANGCPNPGGPGTPAPACFVECVDMGRPPGDWCSATNTFRPSAIEVDCL